MKIDIQIQDKKEYFIEIVNFNQQHNLLFKYPEKPVADKRILNYFWLVFGVALAIASIIGFIVSGFGWLNLIIAITALVYIITFWLVIDGMNKNVLKQKELETDGTFEINEDGIIFEKDNGQIHALKWELIHGIRVYEWMIAFVAQKGMAVDCFIPVEYRDDVAKALKSVNKLDLLFDCKKEDKLAKIKKNAK